MNYVVVTLFVLFPVVLIGLIAAAESAQECCSKKH
jgi:hypothetical protein